MTMIMEPGTASDRATGTPPALPIPASPGDPHREQVEPGFITIRAALAAMLVVALVSGLVSGVVATALVTAQVKVGPVGPTGEAGPQAEPGARERPVNPVSPEFVAPRVSRAPVAQPVRKVPQDRPASPPRSWPTSGPRPAPCRRCRACWS